MKAALLVEVGAPLVVEEVELLPPTPTHLIVRMTASALCYTDCMNRRGDLVKKLPTILGHAGIGVVEEVGAAVTGVAVGDRVVVPGTPECGVCYWCARGRPDQCADLAVPQPHVANRAGGEEVTSSGGGGTYAELMRVPRSWAFPVESGLSDVELSLLGCGITTGLGAVFNVAAVEPGSSVAVVGCGHLGLWMLQAARAAGAAQVIAVDPHDGRRARAGELGRHRSRRPRRGRPRRPGAGADGRPRRRLRPRGGRRARGAGAGVHDGAQGRHRRAHRHRALRLDGHAAPVRARSARPLGAQLPERPRAHAARHPPLHAHARGRRRRREADHQRRLPARPDQRGPATPPRSART